MAIEDNKDYTLKGSQVKDLARRVKESASDISSLESAVAGKQDALTVTQLTAVNSGIDTAKVAQIATNTSDIDSIEEKIPTEASASNKLADKAFVDSSIAIGSISVNGVAQTPDANKNVDLTITSPTVVQTTGTSTTAVMSQNAVTQMVYRDPTTQRIVRIGSTNNGGNDSVMIGTSTNSGSGGVSIGVVSIANATGAVAIGAHSRASVQGQFDIGSASTAYGYNNSNYRLLTGLYDGQSAHDAATKGQLDSLITMTDTDPGEGVALEAGKFIAVYSGGN